MGPNLKTWTVFPRNLNDAKGFFLIFSLEAEKFFDIDDEFDFVWETSEILMRSKNLIREKNKLGDLKV